MSEAARLHRRLAAILAADIAGYARLMGADEEATIEALKAHHAVLLPSIAGRGGRVIDTAGDGILAEFVSVTEAVECAVQMQELMDKRNAEVPAGRRMRFRMGIHLGDVIYDGERIYGEGINIAARLQSLATPGGLCVSSTVRDEVADKLSVQFLDLGDHGLKNIARLVHVYAVWRAGSLSGARESASRPIQIAGPRLWGRDTDAEALLAHAGRVSLLTVVGTGGVGKTSLAKVVLSRFSAQFPDRVHWVDLAPLRDVGQVVSLIAKSLGIELDASSHAVEDLLSVLARTSAVIALDNCEHVLEEVASLVGRAIETAPGVRWFATSREPLHLSREVVYRLEPLGVPADATPIEEAISFGAIALFRERAAASDRRFELDASNLEIAIDLCRQHDGLPLALEMAAARVATLGLRGMHEQLGQRLRLLAARREGPPRHHSLRSTMEWSYELLSAVEQKIFRRLAPFVGGFTFAMAQQIARDDDNTAGALDEWQALDGLSALVDKSLVHRSADRPDRLFLLEGARDYAESLLVEQGEVASLRRRHAQVVSERFESAQHDAERLNDERWISLYASERYNVRAALTWACRSGDPDLLASLAAALAQIDTLSHRSAEVVQFSIPFERLRSASPPKRAIACLELSWAHYSDGSRRLGTELGLLALEDYRSLRDIQGQYRALAQLARLYEARPGMQSEAERTMDAFKLIDEHPIGPRTRLTCAVHGGQRGRTIARLEELEDIAHRSGFEALAAACRTHITDELLIQGRFEEAISTAQRFLDSGELRPRDKALIWNNQALALVQLGRIAAAYEPSRAALQALPSAAHIAVDTFALAAAKQGRMADAAMLLGYGSRIREERDKRSDPAEAAAIAETMQTLTSALGDNRLAELMRVGAAMGTSDVLDLAMPII